MEPARPRDSQRLGNSRPFDFRDLDIHEPVLPTSSSSTRPTTPGFGPQERAGPSIEGDSVVEEQGHEHSWAASTLFSTETNEANRLDRQSHAQRMRDSRTNPSASGRARRAAVRSQSARDSPLPEDDGMGELRKKILAIQAADCSGMEKSRLVHALMTEQYRRPRASLPPQDPLAPHFATVLQRPTHLTTLSSLPSVPDTGPSVSSPVRSEAADGSVEIHASAEDRRPTYHVQRKRSSDKETSTDDEENAAVNESVKAAARTPSTLGVDGKDIEQTLGCAHYMRNVKLQCSQCARWYTCRFCHDQVEDHALDRRATRNMLCMPCGAAQPAAAECRACAEPAAWYYCDICKLWDNDPTKKIYHCDECGICRVGEGLEKDFFHCKVPVSSPYPQPFHNTNWHAAS